MGGVNQIEDIGLHELISGIPTILLYHHTFLQSVSMPSTGHCLLLGTSVAVNSPNKGKRKVQGVSQSHR